MTTSASDEEIHEVIAAVLRFQTIAADPKGVDAQQFLAYAEEGWRLSPLHALLAMASIGAARWLRIVASVRRHDGGAVVEFPREMLESRVVVPPVDAGPEILTRSLDFLEVITRDDFDYADLDIQTVEELDEVGRMWSFVTLHALSLELAMMLMSVDPDRPQSLDQLVAEEALEQEFNWVHGIR